MKKLLCEKCGSEMVALCYIGEFCEASHVIVKCPRCDIKLVVSGVLTKQDGGVSYGE